MRFPISLRTTRLCQRCGLRYSKKEPVCPHCDGLSDDQVRRIRLRHAGLRGGSNGPGRLLLYIAGLVIVVMVIYVLKNR